MSGDLRAPSAEQAERGLPHGTVTFAFTDIEGSTALLRRLGEGYVQLLDTHRGIIRDAVARAGGTEVSSNGDEHFLAFPTATAAVAAVVAAQRELAAHPWEHGEPLRVRIGVHTGEGHHHGDNYVGIDVHRAARIAQAAHGGQVLLSEATRGLVAADLPEGVGLRDLGRHRLRGLAEATALHQLVIDGLPDQFPPLRTADVGTHGLPVPIGSFVGRETEIEGVLGRLGDHRLVTLTGVGGVGKTRLAIEVAARRVDAYADGVRFVDLATVERGGSVPGAIAQALGVDESPGRPIVDSLAGYLADRETLLVLDNCEHVLEDAAEVVAHLLTRCPSVAVLATSRAPLELAGEANHPVPPLALTRDEESDEVPEAVRLFVERARDANPDLALTPPSRAALDAVCRRLDGIPLAIELAAVRTRSLDVTEIADRLDDVFRLLTGRDRTVLPRHQTLRAAIDWSHELLDDRHRIALRRMAVFAGPFGIEDAEAVVAGESIAREDVLDLVDGLVSWSLVATTSEAGASRRYRLLETIRAYSGEQLAESGEDQRLRRRHAEHVADLLEVAERHELGANDPTWAARLAAARDDIRQAINWALGAGDGELALRIAAAGYVVWETKGLAVQGRAWLDRALDLAGEDAPAGLRAKALTAIALLGHHQGDPEAAGFASAALPLWQAIGDREGEALAHLAYGMNAPDTGALEAGRAIYEDLGDDFGIALACLHLGYFQSVDGRRVEATATYERALELARRSGSLHNAGFALLNLARIAMAAGDLVRARELAAEALEHLQAVGDPRGSGFAVHLLAQLDLADGDVVAAARGLAAALVTARRISDPPFLRRCLLFAADLEARHGDATTAARLVGAADRMTDSVGLLGPSDIALRSSAEAAALEELGEEGYAGAHAEGRELEREAALALVAGSSWD